MPRTRKTVVQSTESLDQQPEPMVETISISDACKQLEISEQAFRLALQSIRPDDFDSVRALALPEYEAVAESIQRKALASAPQPTVEPEPQPLPQPTVEPQPQTEQAQPEPEPQSGQVPQPQQPAAPLAQQPQPAPPTPANELAQALQFVLTQQTSLGYSDGLKVEAAATEGAATAYREFLAHQQGYSSTAQSLHQLQQALDITRYQKASGELSEVQQAFLSGLQANSQNLQNQQQSHQTLVNNIKTQSHQQMDQLNKSVLGAIQDLTNQAKDGSESSLL